MVVGMSGGGQLLLCGIQEASGAWWVVKAIPIN